MLVGEICPWEEIVWFPCEASGVNCVGATKYRDKGKASYSNYGKSVRYYATGVVLTGADPDNAIGSQYQVMQGTSFSTPFMAGTAALTWAGNQRQSADTVESCLSAARVGGPDGRFVDTFLSTACGLSGQVGSNIAPFVEITNPATETADFGSVGPVNLVAVAGDFEAAAPITSIFWSSNVEGPLGSTSPGQALFYQPSGPGIRKITASAFDPLDSSVVGTDQVSLSFFPAPPNVLVLQPDGSDVILGLPTDMIAKVTNLTHFPPVQPCSASVWTGFHENSIVFDGLIGCAQLGTFPTLGASHADVSMTVDGLSGFGRRSFKVISDGKLHAKITSPLRGTSLRAFINNKQAATLSAAANVPSTGLTFTWTVSIVNDNGTVEAPSAIVSGQNAAFTPNFPESPCPVSPAVQVALIVTDSWGNIADDHVTADIATLCAPL